MKKAVYFFCANRNIDPVAPNVFNYLQNNINFVETNIIIDENPVMEYNNGNNFLLGRAYLV